MRWVSLSAASVLFLAFALPLLAEKPVEISLRSGQQGPLTRLVIEADEKTVKGANTLVTPNTVKIEFPSPFTLKIQKDFPFETSQRDRFLSITVRNVSDVRGYRLASPPRLVLDLQIAAESETKQPPKGEQRSPVEPVPRKMETPEPHPPQPVQKAQPPFKVLVIDAGHGGYDYGIMSESVKEKDVNLSLASELSAALGKKGLRVFLTRKTDQSVSLVDRTLLANGKTPDLFLSLHSSRSDIFALYTSAAEEPSADTADTTQRLYGLSWRQARHLEKSRSIARALGETLKEQLSATVVLRELPLPLLNSLDAPAVLIEYPSVRMHGDDQKVREKIVSALSAAIISYEQ